MNFFLRSRGTPEGAETSISRDTDDAAWPWEGKGKSQTGAGSFWTAKAASWVSTKGWGKMITYRRK